MNFYGVPRCGCPVDTRTRTLRFSFKTVLLQYHPCAEKTVHAPTVHRAEKNTKINLLVLPLPFAPEAHNMPENLLRVKRSLQPFVYDFLLLQQFAVHLCCVAVFKFTVTRHEIPPIKFFQYGFRIHPLLSFTFFNYFTQTLSKYQYSGSEYVRFI